MKIAIAGAGRVGRHIVRELSRHGYDMVIFERDQKVASAIADQYDVTVVTSDAADMAKFKLHTKGVDTLIAVTESDELNLTLSLLSRKLGIKQNIARIRNEEWFSETGITPEELGISLLIHPERETADYIDRVIAVEGAFDYAEFDSGRVILLGINVSDEMGIAGLSLAELRDGYGLTYFTVIGVYRNNRFIVPNGAEIIEGGDKIWALTIRDLLPLVAPIIKPPQKNSFNRVVIFGGSRIGGLVARSFLDRFKSVTLVEADAVKARTIAEEIEGVKVLHLDIVEDLEAIRELDLETLDCFVAASGDGGKNVMIGLLAKQLGVGKVVAVSDESGYLPVITAIGLDVIADPHLLTAAAILRNIRKGIIHTIVQLIGGEVEIIEYDVSPGSPVAGKRLADAGMPKGSIVCIAIHNGAVDIPTGETILEAGDKAVIIATSSLFPVVEKLFTPRRGFFG